MTTKPFLLLLLILTASTMGDAQGSGVVVYLKDSTEISGELLSVIDSAILVCTKVNLREWEIADNISSIALVKAVDIHKVKVMGRHSTFPLGALVGAAVGAGSGAILGSIQPGMWNGAVSTGPSPQTWTLVFGMIGCFVGIEADVGHATSDTIVDNSEPSAILQLREFARSKDRELPYVKLIDELQRQK